MKMIALLAMVLAGACGDPAEEPMTRRTLALADTVDNVLDSLAKHMGDAMGADVADVVALERDFYIATRTRLDAVAFWIEQIETCADDHGARPATDGLWNLLDVAERAAAGHALSVLLAGDLDATDYHHDELGFQIDMTSMMGELRAQPIYDPDVVGVYRCPVLP